MISGVISAIGEAFLDQPISVAAIGGAAGWAIGVAIGGLITGHVLRLAEPSLQWKEVAIVAIGGAIGGAVILFIGLAIFTAIEGSDEGIDVVDAAINLRPLWYGAVYAAIGGLITGYTLHRAKPSIHSKEIALVAISWVLGATIGGWAASGLISWFSGEVLIGDYSGSPLADVDVAVGGAVDGAIGGLITGYALRLAEPLFQWKQVAIMAVSWALGWAIAAAICGATIDLAPYGALGDAIGGAVGGNVIFWGLNQARSKPFI